MSSVSNELDYDMLVEDFNHRLLTQLRGHVAGVDYLETWVPEEDPVKSILNIIESAQAYGRKDVRLKVAKSTMSTVQQQDLVKLLEPLGWARIMDRGQYCELAVSIGGHRS